MKLIPKYQNAGLVVRQDNTYVTKPTILLKPIKRTYIPTQTYISQDNRSGWQREQDSRKADEEYKKYIEDKKMQQGLENLNGFLNFVDAATIATGVGSVVGKGLRWGGKKLIKKQMNNGARRTLTNEERLGIPKGERNSPSPYKQIGTAIEPKSRVEDLIVDSPLFGDYIGRGSSQFVFNSRNNPKEVLKVYTGRGFNSISEIKAFHKQWMKRNRLPLQERVNFKGYLKGSNRIYPIYSQNKIQPLPSMSSIRFQKEYVPQIDKLMNELGYKGSGTYTNGKLTVGDISPYNMGYNSKGDLRFFDADVYRKGGKLFNRH